MATVTGLTAERMIEMENATVVSGEVVGSNLILHTRDGTLINAGSVIGPMGPAGASFIICTSTTRPVLTAGEQGKAIYETDTKLIRIWIGTRWKLQEKVICTSTTRPAMLASDEGVQIYETDTDLEFTWSGSAWLPLSSKIATFANSGARNTQWPSPINGAQSILLDNPRYLWRYYDGAWHAPEAQGVLFYESNSNDVNVPGNSVIDAPIAPFSFSPIAGRRIKVTCDVQLVLAAGSPVGVLDAELTNSSNTILMQRSHWFSFEGSFNNLAQVTLTYVAVSTGGSMSFKLRVGNFFISSSGMYIQDSLMLVEDIGGV